MPRDLVIYLIDDSPTDSSLVKRAIQSLPISAKLSCFDAGEAALLSLEALEPSSLINPQTATGRPALVILDLNLPGLDGIQILTQIKSDREFRSIPVVVMSSTSEEHEIERCYKAGANSFIRKPADPNHYLQTLSVMLQYWTVVVTLPLKP